MYCSKKDKKVILLIKKNNIKQITIVVKPPKEIKIFFKSKL